MAKKSCYLYLDASLFERFQDIARAGIGITNAAEEALTDCLSKASGNLEEKPRDHPASPAPSTDAPPSAADPAFQEPTEIEIVQSLSEVEYRALWSSTQDEDAHNALSFWRETTQSLMLPEGSEITGGSRRYSSPSRGPEVRQNIHTLRAEHQDEDSATERRP